MLKKSTKALSAILSLSSVASVVAPVTTMAATNIDTLLATAAKTKTFADYHRAYKVWVKLSVAEQNKTAAKLTEVYKAVPQVEAISKLINDQVAIGTTANAEDFWKNYNAINGDVTSATDKAYLLGELASWGLKLLDKVPGYTAATDAIIAANNKVAAKDVEGAKAAIEAAKAKIAAVTHGANNAYLTKTLKTDVQDKLDAYVATLAPKVESVVALNLQQIEVKFNKELDKDSAVDLGNYVASGKTIAKVTLNSDKSSVLVTLATNLANQTGKTDFTVSKEVKFANGNKLGADFVQKDISYTDTVLPTIDSVRAVGNKKIVVTFSEPVLASEARIITNYMMDGKYFSAYTPVIDSTNRILEIDLTTALTSGNHTFKIQANKVTDLIGLKNLEKEVTVVVDAVSTVPTATIVTSETTGNVVAVKFDREIKANPEVKFNGVAGTITQDPEDKTLYYASFGSIPNAGGEVVISKGVEDFFGNKTTEEIKLAFKPLIDTVAPVFVKAESVKENEIIITFDEKIQNPASVGSFKLVDKDGKTVTTTAAYAQTETGRNIETQVRLTGTFGPESYKLTVSGVKDRGNNAMVEVKDYAITVPDKTAPTVASTNIGANVVTITFNEKVNPGTILDINNYLFLDGINGYVAVPAATKLSALPDAKSVKLEFPATWGTGASLRTFAANIAGGSLTVRNIEDISGNKFASRVVTVPGSQTAVATVTGVTTTETKKIVLALDGGELPSEVFGGDFVVLAGSGASARQIPVTDASLDITNRKITLTLAEEMRGDAKLKDAAATPAYSALTVETAASVVVTKTAAGQSLVLAATPVVDKIIPSVTGVAVGDTTDGNNVEEASMFTITFNEDLDSSAGAGAFVDADLRIVGKNGAADVVLVANTDYAIVAGTGANSNKYVVTIKAPGLAKIDSKELNLDLVAASVTDTATSPNSNNTYTSKITIK